MYIRKRMIHDELNNTTLTYLNCLMSSYSSTSVGSYSTMFLSAHIIILNFNKKTRKIFVPLKDTSEIT